MPNIVYTRADLRRFAIANAAYDRKHHPRTWMNDDEIIAALRGHALAFANAHRIVVMLSHADLAFGLATYRRTRAQRRPKHLAATPLPLVSVLGANRASVA